MDNKTTPKKTIDEVLSEVVYIDMPEWKKINESESKNLHKSVERQIRENAKAREEFSRMHFG
jgi:hypothetical protein